MLNMFFEQLATNLQGKSVNHKYVLISNHVKENLTKIETKNM